MATLTLRPNAAGDSTVWTPNTGANYAAVDEASNDGDTTYVSTTSTSPVDDTYNIATDDLLTGATINSVTVYASAKYVQAGGGAGSTYPTMTQLVRVGTTTYAAASADALTNSYGDTLYQWATNPADSAAWEKADIDALQVGIRSARTTGTGSRTYTPYCTQVWVVVDYTPAGPDYTLTAAQGSFTLTGQAATLKASRLLSAAQGSFTLTGQAASLLRQYTLTAAQGSFTLTGQAAALKASRLLSAAQGSYALTGQSAGLIASRVLSAAYGSYTLTGYAIAQPAGWTEIITLGVGPDASLAGFILSGLAPAGGTGPTYTLTAAAGSYALTGQSAGLIASRLLTAAQGSYALTGQSAGLIVSRLLTAAYGSYTLTGYSITNPVTGWTEIITLGVGPDATLTGFILAGLTVSGEAGPTYTLTASPGSYNLTGQSAGLIVSRLLTAAQGSYALTGQSAGLIVSRLLSAAYGVYTLTGQDATLTYSGPLGPTYTLSAAYGAFTLTGQAAALIAARLLTAAYGTYTLTGYDADLTVEIPSIPGCATLADALFGTATLACALVGSSSLVDQLFGAVTLAETLVGSASASTSTVGTATATTKQCTL